MELVDFLYVRDIVASIIGEGYVSGWEIEKAEWLLKAGVVDIDKILSERGED